MEENVQIGNLRKDGGEMNYSKPLLLEYGRKVALASGIDIRILNVSDCRHVSTLQMHQYKVVGMALQHDKVISCDEQGHLFKWSILQEGIVECQPLPSFPLPNLGVVEHIAHLGSKDDSIALVVDLNKGSGPLALLLQRNYNFMMNNKFNILVCDLIAGLNTFSFSQALSFCVVLTHTHCEPAVNIVHISVKRGKQTPHNNRILTGVRTPTCVAVHPNKDTIAVGDHFGGIDVHYKVLNSKQSVSRRMQWHHTPVLDLVFSINGAELYSGASEGVLVQWNLASGGSEDEKSFLPRLGQPITHMALSEMGGTLVATHSDNTFSICDVISLQLSSVLLGNGLSRSCTNQHLATPRREHRHPLLRYDHRTQAVVTSAKAGYLNFYHVSTQEQLFLIDLVHENFVARECRDVIHVDLSRDGLHLVSLDAIADETTSQRLKFWKFNTKKQSWSLECSILDPHCGEKLLGCLFQLTGAGEKPLCLTWTAEQAKLWAMETREDGSPQWLYVDTITLPELCNESCVVLASWSPCGTQVAISTGRRVTVWQVSNAIFTGRITLSNATHASAPVVGLNFSPSGSAVVVVCADGKLCGYSQQHRKLLYATQIQATMLQTSDDARLMAAATKQGKVVLFRGDQGKVLATVDTKDHNTPLALLFCPLPGYCPLFVVRLLCYTSNMDLVSVAISLQNTELPPSELEQSSTTDEVPNQSRLTVFFAETKARTDDDLDVMFDFTATEEDVEYPPRGLMGPGLKPAAAQEKDSKSAYRNILLGIVQ